MVAASDAVTLTVDAASRRSGVALFSSRGRLLAAAAADVPAGAGSGSTPFAHALSRAALMGQEIAVVAGGLSRLYAPRRIIIEYPRIYKEGPRSQLPGDDLLVLAASAMAAWVNLAALYPAASVDPVRPQDWKGQVKKEIMLERILSKLDPDELALLDAKAKKNDNVLDAIGIGLHSTLRR